MRILILITVGLLGLVCLSEALNAQTDDATKKPLLPKVEMLTAEIEVTDPDGNPIEGAKVSVGGLRSKARPGTHWFWLPDRFGTPPKLETDSSGNVTMPYPKFVMEKLETGQMTWTVSHPDFVNFRDDFSVDADPAEIQMKRGFKIAVSANDGETGERLTEDLFANAGGYGTNWKLKKNGMLVSTTMPKKERFLRVVELADGKPARFSERIEIKPEEKSRVLVKDVKLFPGTRVVGKLDDSVTRPVSNGYVTALAVRKPEANPDNWDSRWTWGEKAKIEEDGTFVFESLPTDEVLQMIPVCDGWVPKTPKKSEVAKFFPTDVGNLDGWAAVPQLVKLEGKEVTATLKMVRAKTIRVTVVGPDDLPIVGVTVGCSPNQKWFDGGSQIYGEAISTQDYLRSTREGEFKYEHTSRYSAKTDEQGIATIANLANNRRSRSLYVAHDDFELPITGRGREFKYEFDESGVTELIVKLQKKGTEELDGSEVLEEQNQWNAMRQAVETIGGWIRSLIQWAS